MGKPDKSKESIFTKKMFDDAVTSINKYNPKKPGVFITSSPSASEDLFKGAFTGSSIVENGVRKVLSPKMHLELGSLHSFVTLAASALNTGLGVSIPVFDTGEDPSTRQFRPVTLPVVDHKIHGTSASYADMLMFSILSGSTLHTPTIVSPETTVLEKVVIALESLQSSQQPPSRSAIMVDSTTFNDLCIETGGGNESSKYWGRPVSRSSSRNTFLGVPIIEAPMSSGKGNGDVYIINPQVATVFVEDTEQVGATTRIAGGLLPEAIVISSDPNAHIISKHFDEDTNDWCVDCWTCGYSHWAYTEEEADLKLTGHADEHARLFYRKDKP